MWISVQIRSRGHGNLSEIFASFYELKKNPISFMESTWIQFSHVTWTPDNYRQPVACFSTCLLHLFLRVGIYTPTSLVLELPFPPTRTVDLKVSNVQLRKKKSLNSLLYLLSLTNISVTATCQLLPVCPLKLCIPDSCRGKPQVVQPPVCCLQFHSPRWSFRAWIAT